MAEQRVGESTLQMALAAIEGEDAPLPHIPEPGFAIHTMADGRELHSFGTRAFPCEPFLSDPVVRPSTWHLHEELEFSVALGGALRACGPEGSYVLRHGDGYFANADVPHPYRAEGPEQVLVATVVCAASVLCPEREGAVWAKAMAPLEGPRAPLMLAFHCDGEPWEREAAHQIRAAYRAAAGQEGFWEEEVRHRLTLACHALAQAPRIETVLTAAPLERAASFCAMAVYVEEHFAERITLEALAEAGSVSVREAQRVFKETVGQTPVEYVNERRLYEAARLLTCTSEPVSVIAARCGFQTPSYFSSKFKARYGHSPAEHRAGT